MNSDEAEKLTALLFGLMCFALALLAGAVLVRDIRFGDWHKNTGGPLVSLTMMLFLGAFGVSAVRSAFDSHRKIEGVEGGFLIGGGLIVMVGGWADGAIERKWPNYRRRKKPDHLES